MPAELRHPDLERDTGACRGLLEDHRERAAGEEVMLLAALLPLLEVVREVEHREEVVAAPVGDAGEAAALEAFGDCTHATAMLLRVGALEVRLVEQVAKAGEAGEHPALDRPERLVETLG